MRWLSSLSGTLHFQRTTSIVASLNKHADVVCDRTEAVNQKVWQYNSGVLHRQQSWGGGEQTNWAAAAAAAPAAAALTHGPHLQPPPTSLCSSEKKPLLFPCAGREGGLWGEPPLTPPAIKKKREKKKQGPDFPPLPGVLPTHSPLQHTNTGSSVVPLLRLGLSFPAA